MDYLEVGFLCDGNASSTKTDTSPVLVENQSLRKKKYRVG